MIEVIITMINLPWWFHLLQVGVSIGFVSAVQIFPTSGPLTTRQKIKYFLTTLVILNVCVFLTLLVN